MAGPSIGRPIHVQVIAEQLARKMGAVIRELPRDVNTALNNTAFATMKPLRDEMRRAFNNPTPYTLKSIRVFKATGRRPDALVWLRDSGVVPRDHYLLPQIVGGPRGQKRSEYRLSGGGSGVHFVPAKSLPTDAHGNVRRGLIQQIIAQVGIDDRAGSTSTQTPASKAKRRRKKKRGGEYFSVTEGMRKRGESTLPPGIYERISTGFGSAIRPALVQTKTAPQYRPRFDFYGVVERVFKSVFRNELRKQIAKSIEKSAARGS